MNKIILAFLLILIISNVYPLNILYYHTVFKNQRIEKCKEDKVECDEDGYKVQ